jgi:hypothetical protein
MESPTGLQGRVARCTAVKTRVGFPFHICLNCHRQGFLAQQAGVRNVLFGPSGEHQVFTFHNGAVLGQVIKGSSMSPAGFELCEEMTLPTLRMMDKAWKHPPRLS